MLANYVFEINVSLYDICFILFLLLVTYIYIYITMVIFCYSSLFLSIELWMNETVVYMLFVCRWYKPMMNKMMTDFMRNLLSLFLH
jgi:hypothetical protein